MKTKPRGLGRIFLQPGSTNWWLQYYVKGPDGQAKLVRESSGSRKRSDALALLKKRTGQIGSGTFLDPSIAKTTRLSDLKKLVEDNYVVNDFRTAFALKGNFGRITAHFGDVVVAQITTAAIERFKAEALQRYKPASINRSLSALKRGLRLARRAGLVINEPVIDMLREDNVRQGFLDNAEFQTLRAALPAELQDPVTFLYLSGWRSGEMRSLEWQDVNLHYQMISLRPVNSKNRQGRKLPLTGELLEVLKRAHSRRRLGLSRVFHRDGKPVGDFRKAFATAAKQAGLGHVIPHDLRRCAVRNLARTPGISTNVAMALTGHKTASVFRRYDIVDENDLRSASEKRDSHLVASATI